MKQFFLEAHVHQIMLGRIQGAAVQKVHDRLKNWSANEFYYDSALCNNCCTRIDFEKQFSRNF